MKKILKKTLVYLLLFGELFQTTSVYALTKEENVYAKLNETGDIKNISITEHLFDYNGNIINDKSHLKDIKNINGNEKFTVSGNDSARVDGIEPGSYTVLVTALDDLNGTAVIR